MAKNRFSVDADVAKQLLLTLNTVLVEEVEWYLNSPHISPKEFIQHAIGLEVETSSSTDTDYQNVGEYVWHLAFGNDSKQQSFAASIRENILEEFMWTELEKIGVDISPDNDELSDQLTDAIVEGADSIAKGYLMLLRTNQSNPPMEGFRKEVDESLERAYAMLENYAFGIMKKKIKESV